MARGWLTRRIEPPYTCARCHAHVDPHHIVAHVRWHRRLERLEEMAHGHDPTVADAVREFLFRE